MRIKRRDMSYDDDTLERRVRNAAGDVQTFADERDRDGCPVWRKCQEGQLRRY
jgi:hypothetical protein